MAINSNLFGRYVWLIDTIRSHGRITYNEINELWQQSGLGYGEELPWRTFMHHKKAIMEIFDINIECDKKDGYKYYLEDAEALGSDRLRTWLIDSYATLNQVQADKRLEGRIQFEEIPSGNRFLTRILEAMRRNSVLWITHQGFGRDHASSFKVEPYFVKVYNRRWYLIGRTPTYDQVRIYALDRMQELEILDETFSMPKDFDIHQFFEGCVGIIADKSTDIEEVVIRAYGPARNYLSTLPIHNSQQEIACDEETTTYQYHVRPNFEFLQALLGQADQIEVLKPEGVKEQMKEVARNILGYYGEK